MSFSSDNGYVPPTIEAIMTSIMTNINVQFGTSYTYETFVGSNFYKYFYALAQKVQENEIKTSEIFAKLTQYFVITNESIQRPVGTNPGIIERFAREAFIASVKPTTDVDAGKIFICVQVNPGLKASGNATITNFANLISGTDDSITIEGTSFTAQAGAATPGAGTFQAVTSNEVTAQSLATQINSHAVTSLLVRATRNGAIVELVAVRGGTDGNDINISYTNNDANVGATVSGAALTGGTDDDNYEEIKDEIGGIIRDSVSAGIVTQGSEVETLVLSNGQSFDFKYSLPLEYEVFLKLTLTLSENNQVVIGSPDDVKQTLLDNIAARYRLGKNFEPQRYFNQADAPWTSQVLLEWSIDGGNTYSSSVYDSDFDELFGIDLANITLVEV